MKLSFKKSINLFTAFLLLAGLTIDQPAFADKWGSTYSQSRYSRYRPHKWGSGSSSSSYSGSRYRRSRYKRHNSYRYKRSHGRYSRNRSYRSTFGDDQREIKKKTIYEAPTREDRKIKEDIEKAQIDYGPSSSQAGNLMVKYAQQYYDAKDYVKAQKLAEDIIQLDKVSSIDGLSIGKVEKLRADAIKKQRVSKTHPHRSGRSDNALYKPFHDPFKNRSTKRNSLIISSTRYRSPSSRLYRSPRKRSINTSTARGKITRPGSGITYIDYSKKPSTSPSSISSTTTSRSSTSGRAYSPSISSIRSRLQQNSRSAYGFPSYRSKYRYRSGKSFYPGNYRIFRNPDTTLDSLNGKFKQYSSK